MPCIACTHACLHGLVATPVACAWPLALPCALALASGLQAFSGEQPLVLFGLLGLLDGSTHCVGLLFLLLCLSVSLPLFYYYPCNVLVNIFAPWEELKLRLRAWQAMASM